jgi:C4-dicarboxylate-specific signal transduction histidine kinase
VFDLNRLVINSLDLLRLEARSHQVRVALELASPVPRVLGDHIQIEQTIVNLLRNAFDALEFVPPSERRVVVKTELSNGQIQVHVEDCGKGLTDHELTALFEPFFTTKEHGMGMGLAISRSIIEAHGGRLWATRNPVAGITVHFELPGHEGGC